MLSVFTYKADVFGRSYGSVGIVFILQSKNYEFDSSFFLPGAHCVHVLLGKAINPKLFTNLCMNVCFWVQLG